MRLGVLSATFFEDDFLVVRVAFVSDFFLGDMREFDLPIIY